MKIVLNLNNPTLSIYNVEKVFNIIYSPKLLDIFEHRATQESIYLNIKPENSNYMHIYYDYQYNSSIRSIQVYTGLNKQERKEQFEKVLQFLYKYYKEMHK
jgi:hypothetical protein